MFQKKSFDTKSLLGELFGKCCLAEISAHDTKAGIGGELFTKTTSMRTKKDKDTLSYENLQIWLKDGFEGLESEKRGLPASKILV